MDKCIHCDHEHEYNDGLLTRRIPLFGLNLPVYTTVYVCQDALACGRRRQKAEDERRDPPISYGTGVDGYRIAPQ